MATRDSTLYGKIHTDKRPHTAQELGGRVVPVFFKHTSVTGEVIADIVNLAKFPKNTLVIGYAAKHGAFGAGVTIDIGDVGDPNRYRAADDVAAAGVFNNLVVAGQHFLTTTEDIVILTWAGANPAVGIVIEGVFYTVPGS